MTIQSDFDTFISGIRSAIGSNILNSDLPLIGNDLNAVSDTALQFLDDLKTKVDTVLSAVTGSSADDIVKAFNDANIPGVVAALDPGDNTKVTLTFAENPTINIALPKGSLDFGGSAFGLDAQAAFDAIIKPALNVSLSLDTTAQTLSFVDSATPEFSIDVGVSADLSDGSGGPAQAKLGLIDVKLTDNTPTTTPEIELKFGLDYHSLNPTDFTPTAGGAVDLNLGLETNVLGGLLPTIFADLVVHYDFSNTGASDPTIKFDNVSIGLGSLLDELMHTIKPILDIFSAYPFKDIIHTLVNPLPIIGDIPKVLPFLHLDPVPEPNGDGVLNFLDLAAALDPDDKDTISKFAVALPIIEQLISLNEAAAGDKKISLGDLNLTGGIVDFKNGGTNPLDQLNAFLGGTPGIVQDILKGVQNVADDLDPNPLKTEGAAAAGGLAFPLFDDPSKIVNLLVPSLGDGKPVKFIEYTMPELSYNAHMSEFFPIIGPIGISFNGDFSAAIELSIGYDSHGFETGIVTDGFYLSTPLVTDPLPAGLPPSPNGYMPVGYVAAGIHAGVGVNLVVAEADFEGGFTGGVEAFFPNGQLRFTDIAEGCFFNPFTGELDADVALRITIGFGIFSWTHRIVFAEVTLANFSAECGGGVGIEDPGSGGALATPNPSLMVGPDLSLNVGDRANLRHIGGQAGTDVGEVYAIANATSSSGDVLNPVNTPMPGVLAVHAFGITENYGSADHPMQTITAHLGLGDDSLSLAPDVTQKLIAFGDDGNDRIYGGAGDDELHGGAMDDTLVGGTGNDKLHGDAGNDLLEGGPGADLLDGGDGFDQVTYEHSSAGVKFAPITYNGQKAFAGTGGDAQGDVLLGIEYIIGSQFGDVLWGNPSEGNILEGMAGNDVLTGGDGNDYLLGGPGADFMFGGKGEDGTSYLTSWGAVQIDLLAHNAHGGDAEGDVLVAMEDVQGSQYSDVLLGDNSRNVFDGWLGDDIIDGRGGADVTSGGGGNDIVYGGADGDILDGGTGIDLLTYVNVNHSVTVNLFNRTGANGDKMGGIDNHNQFIQLSEIAGYSSFENLTGSNYSDNLTGDLGYNTIRGLLGDDVIDGKAGNDILIGGGGADHLDGSDGIDTASYEDSLGGVYVSLAGFLPGFPGYGFYNDANGDSLTNIENLRGTLWADILIGDDNNNVIDPYLSISGILAVPGAATDSATGTPIDDVVGGGGYDTLVLDYSLNDFGQALIGGFNSADSGLFTRLNAAGTATLDGAVFSGIEALDVIGTLHDDQIYAGAGNDFVAGGGGNDLIAAGLGSDAIYAQEGDDTVWYGAQETELSYSRGGLNADGTNALFFLHGGRGIDQLSISLSAVKDDVTLVGHAPGVEFHGTNLTLPNGSAIVDFETLGDVISGSGDDWVEQPGNVDNNIRTGMGVDIIIPGLGVDYVYGGADFQYDREIGLVPIFSDFGIDQFRNVVTDWESFRANPGDLLVLDYSSFQGTGGVIGSVTPVQSQFELYGQSEGYYRINLLTNQGSYWGGTQGTANFTEVDFDEIERLYVSGSKQDDLLVGTYTEFESVRAYSNETARGADILNGLDGNDLLIGNSGSDWLYGGNGNDILIGSDPTTPTFTYYYQDGLQASGYFYSESPNWDADQTEVDTLTGGAGADTFVLGTAEGFFYASIFYYPEIDVSQSNRAVITDFNPGEGDVIQLNGNANNYYTTTQDGPGGHTETVLHYISPGYNSESSPDQIVAEIYNFSGLDLNASYIHYVGGPNGAGAEVAAEANIIAEANGSAAARALQPSPALLTTLDLPTPSWVTQDNNPTDLLAALFGGGTPPAGITTVSVNLVGDGRAFGTFNDDPFGIGSGMILSTGQVADLDAPNTVDGGFAAPRVAHLTFEAIGTFNGSTIYRADLSNLGIDISSLTLADSNSRSGGAGGMFSGFDLDAVALSTKYLPNYGGVIPIDLNDPGSLPRLDVFDFSNAGLVFSPGTERTPSPYTRSDLANSVNGLVDNSGARLDLFDDRGLPSDTHGSLTFGDGGSLALNLTQPVSTKGPLYLYVGEAGISLGETISGDISVSSNRTDAPTDLSTDFGAPGAANDDISFTYTFMADASVSQIAFQFALFSEELAEFAGSEFNDSFKILLNGVNLAHLSNGSAATVNNLMASPHVQLSSDLVLNPVGSGPLASQVRADAYTKLLTYAGVVQTGLNVLTIEVADVRDGLMDSGILVKAGVFTGGSGGGGGGSGAPGGGGGISANGGALAAGSPPEIFEGDLPISIPITIDPGFLGTLTAPVTVDFSADPQLDFGNGAGVPFSHTFNPGDPLVFNLQVSAPDDHVAEGLRFDTINLDVHSTDPTFNGMAVAPIVVEIDDPQSHLSISDVTRNEGNLGTTAFDFTVTRTGGKAPLTVDFSTADGTATVVSGDYNPSSKTLSFAEGEMTKIVEVIVNGDIFNESNETFFVNLTNANGGIIDDAQGTGTIVNDDSSDTDRSGSTANITVVLSDAGGRMLDTAHNSKTYTTAITSYATGAGNDSISGNSLGDILNGGGGNDTIRGGIGNDNITGGTGDDRMTGGLGDDIFVFRPNFGHDTITDFAVGDLNHHDTLDLRGLGFASAFDVLNKYTDGGPNAVIHAPTGDDTITLLNVSRTMLASHLSTLQV
jgi:Ca2+-binding RTX toxin-like protein